VEFEADEDQNSNGQEGCFAIAQPADRFLELKALKAIREFF